MLERYLLFGVPTDACHSIFTGMQLRWRSAVIDNTEEPQRLSCGFTIEYLRFREVIDAIMASGEKVSKFVEDVNHDFLEIILSMNFCPAASFDLP